MTWGLLDRSTYFGLTRRRLQTLYMLAAAGLAALVPLILFTGFWIRSELGKSYRDLESDLSTRTHALSQRVDAEIEQQIVVLRALSALPALDTDGALFEEQARRVTSSMSHWSSLSLVDSGTGRVIFSARTDGAEEPDPAMVKEVAANRRPAVEARQVRVGRRGGVLLYVPVIRDGATARLLMMSLDPQDIQDIVAAQPGGPDVVAVVVDRHNRVLARSLSPDDTIGTTIRREFAEAIGGDGTGGLFDAVWSDGEPIRGAFLRSRLTGWAAVSSMDRRVTDQVTRRAVWATVATAALSLIVAGILTVFIIHTVMERRVSDERLAASRALGDLDARLLATTQDALNEQRKSASEREVLLREIYHRVKNNLQIVQSLLRLGSRDLKAEQREPFEGAVRRIGAMARVHTLLYNSPDLASIDFKDYLDELLKELAEGFAAEERSIESVLEADAMRMPLDTAVPLAFIAVEILTNSFKHAFPSGRAGRITVEVQRQGDEAVLKIHDDGVGMSHEPTGKRRLGLTIVRKLVQQIGGTLEEPPPGSSVFSVRFPIGSDDADQAPRPEREAEAATT